jgi:hypothetical protein
MPPGGEPGPQRRAHIRRRGAPRPLLAPSPGSTAGPCDADSARALTRTETCAPHLDHRALDGGDSVGEDQAALFHPDRGPSQAHLHTVTTEVSARDVARIERHADLDEGLEPGPDDPEWRAASREPLRLLREPSPRERMRFEVHAAVRVDAGDQVGRARLMRFVARLPFAVMGRAVRRRRTWGHEANGLRRRVTGSGARGRGPSASDRQGAAAPGGAPDASAAGPRGLNSRALIRAIIARGVKRAAWVSSQFSAPTTCVGPEGSSAARPARTT